MENNVSQGYGSAEDMMMPQGDQLDSQEGSEEQDAGGDMEAMISEGVQAYMESQDPEIAHQVIMMLAEAMGIAGGQEQAPAPADPMAQGTPMAKNGGKFGWFGNEESANAFQKYISQ